MPKNPYRSMFDHTIENHGFFWFSFFTDGEVVSSS